jgi:hypothetical protein
MPLVNIQSDSSVIVRTADIVTVIRSSDVVTTVRAATTAVVVVTVLGHRNLLQNLISRSVDLEDEALNCWILWTYNSKTKMVVICTKNAKKNMKEYRKNMDLQ